LNLKMCATPAKFFFTMWTLWTPKDAEFYVDFKNKKNFLSDKMHLNKDIPKNIVNCDFFQFITKTAVF
jgi:murein L,D-transpeptidase YafK